MVILKLMCLYFYYNHEFIFQIFVILDDNLPLTLNTLLINIIYQYFQSLSGILFIFIEYLFKIRISIF